MCLLCVPLELHDVLPQMNVVDYISFSIATTRDLAVIAICGRVPLPSVSQVQSRGVFDSVQCLYVRF